MSKSGVNKSKTYLLPLLFEYLNFNFNYFYSLENTYIFDNEGIYEDCIFVEHKFEFSTPEYAAYESKLIENELFVDLIDNGNNVIYIFRFPEDFLEEYNLYKAGKYSHFGEDAKVMILDFYTNAYKGNLNAISFLIKLKQVLYRDKELRKRLEKELNVKISEESELTDIINTEKETFNITEHLPKININSNE